MDIRFSRRELLQATGVSVAAGAGIATSSAAATEPGGVTLVDADPNSGFHYPYFLYTPEQSTDRARPILVQPNNSGTSEDDLGVHRDSARSRIERGIPRRIAEELAVPCLVPVFPRPRSNPVDWTHYVHALDDTTVGIDDGPLERVDRQLLSMVDHARELLGEAGYPTQSEVLLNGFSAAGNFVNRFVALQPDRVKAASPGGINGTALLPLSEADGRELPYHVGVADLPELVGEAFDADAWQDVDQYIHLGGADENDTIPYDDAWTDDSLRQLALDVYGEHMQVDRMPYCRSVYEDAGYTGRIETIPTIGHNFIEQEIVDFHRKHVEQYHVHCSGRPAIGATSVPVTATVDTDGDSAAVRVYSTVRGDLTAESVAVSPGETRRATVDLTDSIRERESLTIALVPPEEPDLNRAFETNGVTAGLGRATFTTTPEGGDTEIQVEYELSSGYDPTNSVELRVYTEEGGMVVLDRVSPGDDGQLSDDVETDQHGIPFCHGRDVTVGLYDGDIEGLDPIVSETVEVTDPETLAIDLESLTVDDVVLSDSVVTAEAAVRGLGGTGTVSFSVLVGDEEIEVGTETVSVETGDRERIETSFRVDEHDLTGVVPITVWTDTGSIGNTFIIAKRPATGLGTSDDPFQIQEGAELAYMATDLDSQYELIQDIDLSAFSRFVRIGTADEPFVGHLDGNGHEIQQLSISESPESPNGVGLFGNVRGTATITDLVLDDVTVEGEDAQFVGGLIGHASGDAVVDRVAVTGEVTGDRIVGGIVGGTASGGSFTIRRCASMADVSASSVGGGVIGQQSGHTVESTYSTGSVAAGSSSGGIVGTNWFGGAIHRSFAVGTIDGIENGLIGRDDGDGHIEHGYWDAEATGQDGSSSGGTPLSTADMTGMDASDHMSVLDFDATWETVTDPDNDYPVLQWQETDPEPELGTVTGMVSTTDDDPLAVIDIEFANPDTETIEATTTTDENGEYTIELKANRTYELIVEADRFETFSTQISVEPDESHTVPIELSPDDGRQDDEGESPAAAYAGDDGIIRITGVLEAVSDYGDDEIGITVALEVIGAYGSGERIE